MKQAIKLLALTAAIVISACNQSVESQSNSSETRSKDKSTDELPPEAQSMATGKISRDEALQWINENKDKGGTDSLGNSNSTQLFGFNFHTPTPYGSEEEALVDKAFFVDLNSGNYDRIAFHKQEFSRLLSKSKSHIVSQARLGFLNLWTYSERFRNPENLTPDLFQNVENCTQFFKIASKSAPKNIIYKGFSADCSMLEGLVENKLLVLASGVAQIPAAIGGLPEFNNFTIGYALTSLPYDNPIFSVGLELLFANLDVCFKTHFDRNNPDVTPFLAAFKPEGNLRFCANTAKAPHNFEGFFMVIGDVLIKAGKVDAAKAAYRSAMAIPSSFNSWPFKNQVLDRINHAQKNVEAFRNDAKPLVMPTGPTMMFHSTYSCMGCHQAQ
ncbi:MAG: hypothetical protein NTX25_18675 [Proteobacteria bacterium]|nr:hypothetical protein [Pseudomonadota bacterium]